MHGSNKVTDARMDQAGLGAALVVSIVMLLVSFTSIAPDIPSKFGMGILSFVVGIFGIRGYLMRDENGKRVPIGIVLCVAFFIVEVFSHSSFTLILTDVQSASAHAQKTTYEDDPEYKRLVGVANSFQTSTTNMAGAVATMKEGFRTEVDIRQSGVKTVGEQAKEASEAVTKYVREWKAEQKADSGEWFVKFDANAFFTAIPDAITSGNPSRWIALGFCIFIFSGVLLTGLVTADGAVKAMARKREEEEKAVLAKEAEKEREAEANKPKPGRKPGVARNIPKKVVYAWVDALWHDHRNGTSDKIIDRDLTLKFLLEKKIPITKLHDEKLFNLAVRLKLFTPDGTILKTAIEARTALDDAQKRKE